MYASVYPGRTFATARRRGAWYRRAMSARVDSGVAFAAALLLVLLAGVAAGQRRLTLKPGESFETAIESLRPGDHLTVMPGRYEDAGRISLSVKGTRLQPVVITGVPGGAASKIVRPAGAKAQNTINVEGATWVTIRHLEITSNGGDGINLSKRAAFITLEDLHIHHVDVGVNFRSDLNHITVRRCHIHDTGQNGGTGEGLYVGCNRSKCIVRDCLIEANWIHGTLASTQGDGIEIKRGSHSNVVRDNVIHDTRYPGILLYGTDGKPRNVVEGNVIWGARDSGIQCAADAVIRNNIVFAGEGTGFNSQPHQGVTPGNLEFVHNTIIGGAPAIRLAKWAGAKRLVFANNAVYATPGRLKIFGLKGVAFSGNVFQSPDRALPAHGWKPGDPSRDFVSVARRSLWPRRGSALGGAADPAFVVGRDFEGAERGGRRVAGAYSDVAPRRTRWRPKPGFKPSR